MLSFTVTSSISDMVSQTYSLERRTVANWVAQNQLNQLRLSRINNAEPIALGTDQERVVMARRDWQVEIEITDTDHPWLRRVEIQVFELTDEDVVGPIDRLTAFLGRY